jgi:2-hydroxy-3-oxopropionate reductase
MSKPNIGFIGLGLMGTPMVENLLNRGYTVRVLGNRDRTGIERMLAKGADEAATARELAETVDVVMLCMGTSDHVEGRMRGPDGVITGLSAGKVVVDFGTSLPSSTRALGDEVAAKGAAMMDAPLGRTPAHAIDGLLNIMAAGDDATFAKMKPVFEDQGENVFHVGPLGAGHTIKLMNNFFGMTQANAMCEAFAIADKAGVSRQTLFDVVAAGPLKSGMMEFVSAYALDGDATKLEFSIANAGKDVGYYNQMVTDLGLSTVMGKGPGEALARARDEGHGDEMVSQMVDSYARWFSD